MVSRSYRCYPLGKPLLGIDFLICLLFCRFNQFQGKILGYKVRNVNDIVSLNF